MSEIFKGARSSGKRRNKLPKKGANFNGKESKNSARKGHLRDAHDGIRYFRSPKIRAELSVARPFSASFPRNGFHPSKVCSELGMADEFCWRCPRNLRQNRYIIGIQRTAGPPRYTKVGRREGFACLHSLPRRSGVQVLLLGCPRQKFPSS